MKNFLMMTLVTITASIGVLEVPEDPFSYSYEIVSSSRSPKDMCELYYAKEHIINTYEAYFMNLDVDKIGEMIKNSINLFLYKEDSRAYYIGGSIVLLLGEARGSTLKGELRSNECDTTVIREKFYIFDLFS